MPKKKGPPYLDDPECKYVVIENPWPQSKLGGARGEAYFQEVGAWLRYALNKAAYPETVYSRSTRSDLVVKFSQDVDIRPLLGAHFWPNFLKQPGSGLEISSIFEFDYRRQGHPENHQWAIHEVDLDDPPQWRGKVPFKQPYHPPTFAEVQKHNMSCAEFALPMPRPRELEEPQPEALQPKPSIGSAAPQAAQLREGSLYAFAHAMVPKVEEGLGPGRAANREASARPEQLPPPSSVRSPTAEPAPDPRRQTGRVSLFDSSKFDPYEQEEAAANFLKAEPTDSRLPPPGASVKQEAGASAIKPEPSGPSEELRREYREYQQTQRARIVKEEQAVKGEPHRPSAELVAEFNDYQNTRSQQATAEPSQSPAPSSAVLAFQQELQHKQAMRGGVKPKPRDSYMNQRSDRGRSEDRNQQQPYERRSMKPDPGADPRSFHRDRQGSSVPASAFPHTEPWRDSRGSSTSLTSHDEGRSLGSLPPRPVQGQLQGNSSAHSSSMPRIAHATESRMQDLRDRMRRESTGSGSVKREREPENGWDFKRRRY